MTTLDHRPLAPAVPLRRSPRRPRTTPAPGDLHAQLVSQWNRLLNATDSTEGTSAYEALAYLAGALIGAFPSGGRALSQLAVVDMVERTANRLGCPPAGLARSAAAPDVTALVDALMGAEDLLSQIVTVIGDAKTDLGTSRYEASEARLHSLVEELACEHDLAVTV